MFSFSRTELLEIAIRIETNAAHFYNELAQKADTQALRELALEFAQEELEHAQIFRQLLQDDGFQTDTLDEQAIGYLRAWADSIAFREKHVYKDNDINSLLERAVAAERDALLFYYDLQKHCCAPEVLDKFIEEEKKHYTDLVNLLTQREKSPA
ncbi:MAG: ferritin family protein [Limnochordia bacterium]